MCMKKIYTFCQGADSFYDRGPVRIPSDGKGANPGRAGIRGVPQPS